MQISRRRHLIACTFGALAITTLAACGNKSDSGKATQVIAKVNDAELSIHQLNFALQGVGQVPAEQLATVRKNVLDRLVEQEAIVQEAISKKVDRDPTVQQQLEAARREILVRNHMQKVGAAVQPPSADTVSKFYKDNPGLFESRNVYQFTEMVFPRPPAKWTEIEKALKPAKTINEVIEALKPFGINLPVSQNIVRGAEDLPLEVVNRLSSIKDGEIVIYGRAPAIIVAQVVARKSVPVDEAKAKPMVERFLLNKARTEAIQAEAKRVREAAKVSYLGEFSGQKPAAPPPADVPTKDNSKEVIEKGIKGLK